MKLSQAVTPEIQEQALAAAEQAIRLALALGVPESQLLTLTRNVAAQERAAS